jgi:hypothetical protein
MFPQSKQTRSFIILLLLVAAASYGAITMSRNLKNKNSDTNSLGLQPRQSHSAPQTSNQDIPLLNTDDWDLYEDDTYPLSFKYPTNWTANIYTKNPDFYIITLKPQGRRDNIRIYVSNKKYFALDNIDTTPYTVSGAEGVNVDNMVIGAHFGANYYTFDIGTNTALMTEFNTMVQTVKFR